MNLVVRLVYIVSLAVVLFHENGSSLRIDAIKINNNDDDKHEILQPIEHVPDSSGTEKYPYLEEKENYVATFNDLFSAMSKQTEEEIEPDSSTNKNRVVRQANGNLYPQLGTPYYGNQQNYQPSGPGPYNSSYGSNSNPYNPLANTTFNQYTTPTYPISQNGYYINPGSSPYNNSGSPFNNPGVPANNPGLQLYNPGAPYNSPGSPYHYTPPQGLPSNNPGYQLYNPGAPNNSPGSTYHYTPPQGSPYNQYNNSRPGQQYPYGSSTSRYPTYPQNPYPSKNNFSGSGNSSSHYPGQSYGTHNTGYPTSPPYNGATTRPGYPYGQTNSTQWQGNYKGNNTHGYNNYNTGRPGQHNHYPNTTPRYPHGQYPVNNYPGPRNSTNNGGPGLNFGPMYPSPPPYHAPNPRPVTPFGQNNSSYNSQWNNSYGNNSRPHVVNSFNNSNDYGYNNTNNYNPHNYPNSNPQYGSNYPSYPTPSTYANGGQRAMHGAYPTPSNNGQAPNNWNPVQPYNSNGPYDNPNLFNYPSKYNTTNPNSIYDPRRNPPHNFSY